MSILDEVLIEEYERSKRFKKMYQEKLQDLPKGYLSRKNIKGKVYYYLQYRDGEKIVSQFVPNENVESLQKQIEDRRKYEKRVREVEADLRKIRKAVGSLVRE